MEKKKKKNSPLYLLKYLETYTYKSMKKIKIYWEFIYLIQDKIPYIYLYWQSYENRLFMKQNNKIK